MSGPVLLDTGPLVAYLDRREQHHGWAKAQFAQIRPPQLTCEAVLTEACFLLQQVSGGEAGVIDLLRRGLIGVPFRLIDELEPVAKLLARYANVPMSLADACLVRMAEQHGGSRVFTLDRDFKLYRMHGRQVVPTLMPK